MCRVIAKLICQMIPLTCALPPKGRSMHSSSFDLYAEELLQSKVHVLSTQGFDANHANLYIVTKASLDGSEGAIRFWRIVSVFETQR